MWRIAEHYIFRARVSRTHCAKTVSTTAQWDACRGREPSPFAAVTSGPTTRARERGTLPFTPHPRAARTRCEPREPRGRPGPGNTSPRSAGSTPPASADAVIDAARAATTLLDDTAGRLSRAVRRQRHPTAPKRGGMEAGEDPRPPLRRPGCAARPSAEEGCGGAPRRESAGITGRLSVPGRVRVPKVSRERGASWL